MLPQKMRLEEQVVLVTGASRGLGAQIARAFAAEGAKVVINYLKSHEKAAELAQELVDAIAIQADVSSEAEVKALFAHAEQHYGKPVSTLVNNALPHFEFNGNDRQKLGSISWASFEQQIQGSVRGTLNTTQAALPGFRRLGFGRIINIGSNLVQNPVVPYQDYTTAKAALLGLTRTTAAELGPQNVTCNMVSGGLIRVTDASQSTPDAVFEQIEAITPLRRVMSVEDIANAVLFFASPWAGGCTGQNINVDGGLVMA